ncbi:MULTISPECIES: hypothetical protein [Planktothricoides]|uniref:Uncharacterized protein n=1 Tax=Planktothricoides raciborskii FACHB-1370 TaxID=2949576 RepID=A0ABR8ECJ6_9CYAN|nr:MULTISPECIES: hypothetical protein [Planktothricoides]MBD2544584.1 hypothetical protein [Planktothricoides raciborskii FACHB-1370]MBD2583529.1 hypothetical protein [Planktothricoides raciborskii FACHB-1261]
MMKCWELIALYSGFLLNRPQILVGAKHSSIKSLLLTHQYLPECFAPTDISG